ncbi:MAG TPA: tetratricopeptide repeat protein, partial [Terriglobales bacterium]|nr:tetratricopeptide repeat protein [Terriglobales bacterium]
MKTPLVALLFFFAILLFPIASYTQGRPGSGGGTGGGGSRPTTPTNPTNTTINPGTRTNNPFPDTDHPLYISGKVVMADGSPISESVTIESICGGRKRVETYTDSHGSFSFELKKKSSAMAIQGADSSLSNDEGFAKSQGSFAYRDCELQASLPGFTSESVQLAGSMSSMIETTDVGRIVIRPIGGTTSSVLSATSLAAPGPAKKAMDKALDQEKKNKVEDAEKSLQKAVEIYPQYAAAWTELGRLQYAKHDSAGAQHSFQQAVAADPKYAKPYLGLAQLEAQSAHWQNTADLTTKLLALNSNYPMAWLMQGIAQYNLRQFDAAETSVRNGLKTDAEHRVPRLEHLLGLILTGKKDYVQAAEHMRAFVKYSTASAEQTEGQKMLAEIEKRSA